MAIVAPTCFYYQTAVYRALSADPRLDLSVYFCSDEGVTGSDVRSAYGPDETWGIENKLLQGYRSKFLKNYSPWGSYLKSLVGLANLGIWSELKRQRPDAVIIMSWMNPTWWLTILACFYFKIPLLFMTDANISAEQIKSPWKSSLKGFILGKALFPLTTGFLCAGTANREFYSHFEVPARRLVRFAYSWGYSDLIEASPGLLEQRSELRRQYGLPEDAVVILYCGRLSPEKGSMEMLQAYKDVDHPKKALLVVGDGRLKRRMQDYIANNGIESVHFMGFQSRNEIGKFYAMADCLVLPSYKETWGIVVNEALCFSLPVVVSDQVGAGVDLLIHGENGYVFPAGNVQAMAESVSKLTGLPKEERIKMGENSYELIKKWTDRNLADPLVDYLDTVIQLEKEHDSRVP